MQIINNTKILTTYGGTALNKRGAPVSSIKNITDGKKTTIVYGTTVKILRGGSNSCEN